MRDFRITPARAGNRLRLKGLPHVEQDHPRACGEQLQSMLSTDTIVGSPPRVRGTVNPFPGGGPADRITPARAGNSFAEGWHGRVSGDHPRACGEQDVSLRSNSPHQGSPPRVRGTVDRKGCE